MGILDKGPILRVAFAIDGTFIGGGHRHVLMLAKGLRARGGEPLLIVSGEGPFTDDLKDANLKFIVLPMGKIISLGKILQWRRVLKVLPVAILHLHGGVAGFWGRLALPSTRKYKTFWTIHGIHYPHLPNKLLAFIWLKVFRFLKNKADVAICVSRADYMKAIEDKIVNESKTRVISNGIELDKFKASSRARDFSAQSVSIRLGVVGRLTRVKGQRYALEAMEILKGKYPGLSLVFYGVGEDLDHLKKLSVKLKLLDRVTFAGFQSDVLAAYQTLDISLMPSLWEGQGLTLMESIAAGVPMVASSLDCIKEIVSHERECLLVPSKDPRALAQSIERLILDKPLRRLMVAKGLATAQHFDVNRMIEETIELYHRVIKNETPI